MLACSEHIAFTTFILAPLAGVVSYFAGYWQPSLLELAVVVPLWIAVQRFIAAAFKAMGLPLHVLVNNAGAVVAPVNGKFVRTPDGLECMMGCNFVAAVLLVDELLPLLKASRGRVIIVSSNTHATCGSASNIRRMLSADPDYETVIDPGLVMGFTHMYGLSKLGGLYLSKELADKHPEITAVALHPGGVVSDVWRNYAPIVVARNPVGAMVRFVMSLFFKTCSEGAVTTLTVATAPKVKNGAYYADGGLTEPSALANDRSLRDEVMDVAYRNIKKVLG
jgi:NAD(P)-dependent dehydrogenase (short-subunit alcohol dehydrogenase family)